MLGMMQGRLATGDMDILTVLHNIIAEKVGRNRFELWFGRRTTLAISGDSLIVGVPNAFVSGWLKEHFREALIEACEEAVGRPLRLDFRVPGEEPAEPTQESPSAEAPSDELPSDGEPRDGESVPPPVEKRSKAAPAAKRAKKATRRAKKTTATASASSKKTTSKAKKKAAPKRAARPTTKKKTVRAKKKASVERRSTLKAMREADSAAPESVAKPIVEAKAVAPERKEVLPPKETPSPKDAAATASRIAETPRSGAKQATPARRTTRLSKSEGRNARSAEGTQAMAFGDVLSSDAKREVSRPPRSKRATRTSSGASPKGRAAAAPKAGVSSQANTGAVEKPAKPSGDSSKPASDAMRLVTGKDGKLHAVLAAPNPVKQHGRAKLRTFKTFVEGRSNRLARMSVELAVQQPGQVSPIYIHGPASVGKTHLLEAVLAESQRVAPRNSAVLITAEQFTTEFIQSVRGSGLPNLRSKYRNADLFLVDDLQFLLGKRATIAEFRYTIDTLLRAGKQMVFTGDRPISQLRELGSDLVSRLESGMPCRIEAPELETRLGIVQHMAREMQVGVSDEICRFVASRFTNHARELAGALCRLKAASLAKGEPMTLELAESSLDDLIRDSRRILRLSDIEAAVCETFGLDTESLQSKRRAKAVSHPRMLAMWLARKYTRSALSEIGRYFGNRSHSTVASAKKRVDNWLDCGAELALADRDWTVDEAIQRVEQHLHAG